jgi:hypothetical protein
MNRSAAARWQFQQQRLRGWNCCGDYLLLPFGLSFACVIADAATLFCAGVDLGFERIFDAFEATLGLVFSFLAICFTPVETRWTAFDG